MTPPAPKPPRDVLDRLVRESLLNTDNLRAFLSRAVPALADQFLCERARLMDREFPVDDWRRREADLPFEIPYRCGNEERLALVCLLLEHQSDPDPLMPLRLLYFAVTYWDRQWRAWRATEPPRPELKLNPVLPLVFYTGTTGWTQARTLAGLLGEPAALHAFAPSWQPLFWNLADQPPEQLLESGDGWLQVLAVIRAQFAAAPEFEAIYSEVQRRLQGLSIQDRVRWYDLQRILIRWGQHRRPQGRASNFAGRNAECPGTPGSSGGG